MTEMDRKEISSQMKNYREPNWSNSFEFPPFPEFIESSNLFLSIVYFFSFFFHCSAASLQ